MNLGVKVKKQGLEHEPWGQSRAVDPHSLYADPDPGLA